VTNRAGQGQGRARWPWQTPAHWTCWLYVGSLGKTGGPASNQTKIQFKKKIIFIIEHILKKNLFEKENKKKNIKIEKHETNINQKKSKNAKTIKEEWNK
jgi:hypothetical protein